MEQSQPDSDTPFQIGLVGAGGISRAHLLAFKAFPDQLKLTAVCDINREAAEKFVEEAGGGIPIYDSVEDMLSAGGFDAVDLCTVHSEHYPQAKAALEAGYPVLIEKPFATRIEDCEELVELADKKDLCLMIGQCQRFDPSYVAARKAIRTGVLGEIRGVRFDCMQNLEFYVKPGHWLWDGDLAGGGIVISVMVHRLDLMRYLVGDVKRVTAVGRSFHKDMINGAEDFVTAILEFENGAVGEAFGTYVGYRLPYSESFMIFGEKGTVHAVPDKGQWMGPAMIAVDGEERGKDESAFAGFETIEGDPLMVHELGFVNEILHFAECCRSGREPDSSGRDNLKTMKVIFGIMESIKTGKPVEIE